MDKLKALNQFAQTVYPANVHQTQHVLLTTQHVHRQKNDQCVHVLVCTKWDMSSTKHDTTNDCVQCQKNVGKSRPERCVPYLSVQCQNYTGNNRPLLLPFVSKSWSTEHG